MNSEKQSTNLQMTLREVNRVGEGQKNVPKLRFKGYEDAWEQRKLGDLVQFVNGRAYKQEELLDVGKYKVVRVGNFNTNEKWYFSDLELETDKYMDNGDLLYLWATSFGPVIWQGEKAIFHYHIWKLKNFENLDKKYLYSFLEWDKNKISQNTNGSTMVHITKNMIEQRDIEYPTKSEQYRIGSLLESVDNLITLHQRKYDALKSMKKTLLSKMFPKNGEDVPEIRFKEFTDAWEQRKLGEVSQIVGGGTPSTGIPEYWDGDIDWYSPVEIGEEIFVSCSQRKITQLGLEKSSAKILPEGTVLFTSRAGIGNTAILEKEGCTNQGFQSIVPKDNELDSYFIFSCSHLLKKYGETKGAGSTFVEISGKQMSLMPLNIPEIKEQKSVGNFFRKLDSIITLHQRKLDELKNMKKTLLQQMFV